MAGYEAGNISRKIIDGDIPAYKLHEYDGVLASM